MPIYSPDNECFIAKLRRSTCRLTSIRNTDSPEGSGRSSVCSVWGPGRCCEAGGQFNVWTRFGGFFRKKEKKAGKFRGLSSRPEPTWRPLSCSCMRLAFVGNVFEQKREGWGSLSNCGSRPNSVYRLGKLWGIYFIKPFLKSVISWHYMI